MRPSVSSSDAMNNLIESLICCPYCHGSLGQDACRSCGKAFSRSGSQLRFVSTELTGPDATFQSETFRGNTLRGRLFNAGKGLISSEY